MDCTIRVIGTSWLLGSALAAGCLLAVAAKAGDSPRAGAADAKDQTVLDARISHLIDQLGAEDFAIREKAQGDLAQLGLEAFDAVHAAQSHHDPEIALRARYLVRSMSVRWFSESDPPEVVRILKGYGDLPEAERPNRVDLLAALENRQGIVPLCRLSRYETIEPLAKNAALKILESGPPTDDAAKAELAKTISGIVGSSKRPAAHWLRLYARTLIDPASTLADWDQATQAEDAVRAKNPERTSPEIVRDLYRYQVELLKSLARDNEAIAVIRRTFSLLDGTPDQVEEIVAWLIHREAWPVVLEVLQRFDATVADNPLLLYRLAETFENLGDAAKADEVAHKALGIRPENLDEHRRVAEILEELRGHPRWAEDEYQQIIKEAIKIGQQAQMHEAVARMALCELLHDRFAELEAAEALQPLCDLLQKEEAFRMKFEASFIRKPEEVIARMNYFFACYHHEQGNLAKERLYLQAAIDAEPTDADVLIAMYRLPGADATWKAMAKEKITAAARDFHARTAELRASMEMSGNEENEFARFYARECNMYAWLVGNTIGDYEEAVKLSHEAVQLSEKLLVLRPNYPGFLDTLGRCYYAKGDLASAVKYQSLAAKLNPDSGQIRRQLEFFRQEATKRGVELPAEERPSAAKDSKVGLAAPN